MGLRARLFLVTLFVGLVLLLPRPPHINAQWPASQCIKSFFTEYESPCANCCNDPTVSIDAISSPDNTSPGFQSAFLSNYNCGGGTGCTGYNCGTGDYYQQEDDPTCCSGTQMQCTSDSACCTGYACDLTLQQCASCVQAGDYAQLQWDCCSGTGNYDNGEYQCE